MKNGMVSVIVEPEMEGQRPKLTVTAMFVDYSAANLPPPDGYSHDGWRATDCRRRAIGTCHLTKCKMTPEPGLTFATFKTVPAGAVTVARSSDNVPVDVPADSSSIYYLSKEDPAAVAVGETVTVTVSGADVPAFSEKVDSEA